MRLSAASGLLRGHCSASCGGGSCSTGSGKQEAGFSNIVLRRTWSAHQGSTPVNWKPLRDSHLARRHLLHGQPAARRQRLPARLGRAAHQLAEGGAAV